MCPCNLKYVFTSVLFAHPERAFRGPPFDAGDRCAWCEIVIKSRTVESDVHFDAVTNC